MPYRCQHYKMPQNYIQIKTRSARFSAAAMFFDSSKPHTWLAYVKEDWLNYDTNAFHPHIPPTIQ